MDASRKGWKTPEKKCATRRSMNKRTTEGQNRNGWIVWGMIRSAAAW